MEDEGIIKLTRQRVDLLCITLCTQRGHNQRLGFAACKQGRTVGARQHGSTDFDGAHSTCVTAVDTGLTCQNLRAHDACFDVKQHAFDLDSVELHALRGQRILDLGIGLAAGLRTHLLVTLLIGCAQQLFTQLGHLGDQRLILGWRRPVPSGLATFTHQIMDGVNCNLALLVAIDHSAASLLQAVAALRIPPSAQRFQYLPPPDPSANPCAASDRGSARIRH